MAPGIPAPVKRPKGMYYYWMRHLSSTYATVQGKIGLVCTW